jgi:hypothetical protein
MAEEYYFEWMAFTSCVIALQVGFKASPILWSWESAQW